MTETLGDGLVEIAKWLNINMFEVLMTHRIPGFEILQTESLEDVTLAQQNTLFGEQGCDYILYLTALVDLTKLSVPEGTILLLDPMIYVSKFIPKTEQFNTIKPAKPDPKLIKQQLIEYNDTHQLFLSQEVITALSRRTYISEILLLIPMSRLIPDNFIVYLKEIETKVEVGLYILPYSSFNLVAHTTTWCKRVDTEEEIAIATALLATKIIKSQSNTVFYTHAMEKIIHLDISIKSSTKKTSKTLFREMLYDILHT